MAEWIEYDNRASIEMLSSVDDSEKVIRNVYTLGGRQESWFLTKDGLYEILMTNRKQIAKEFR